MHFVQYFWPWLIVPLQFSNLRWPDSKKREKLDLLPLLHHLLLLLFLPLEDSSLLQIPFCNHCKIWLLSWRRRPCSAVYLFWKSDPGSVQNISIGLLWLAAWSLECLRLVFWLATAVFSLATRGRGWPQGPAYRPHIIAFNITGEKHKTEPGSKLLEVL